MINTELRAYKERARKAYRYAVYLSRRGFTYRQYVDEIRRKIAEPGDNIEELLQEGEPTG